MKKNDMPIRHKTIKRRRIRTVIERLMLIAVHLTVHARKIILALGRSSPWANTFIRIWRVLSEGWFVDFLNLTFWLVFYTLLTLGFPLFYCNYPLIHGLLWPSASGWHFWLRWCFLWWVLRIEVEIKKAITINPSIVAVPKRWCYCVQSIRLSEYFFRYLCWWQIFRLKY